MPPPPPPPMKYVSKTMKSPPRQPVSPAPGVGSGSTERKQPSSSPPTSTVPTPVGRPRSSTVATPEKPNGGNNKSPMGRSRAMSRPAGRPPPQFANNNQGVASSVVDPPAAPHHASSPPHPSTQVETRPNPPSPLPPPTHHHQVPQQQLQQQRAAPTATTSGPSIPHHHYQPPTTNTQSSSSSSPSPPPPSQHLEYENKELRNEVQKLKGTVETLQRDNNLLQDRLGSLLDCGITPTSSTLEAYAQSRQKDSLLTQPSSMSALAAAAGVAGGATLSSSASLEYEFMKVRIQRLEAALALEMKARESLEDTCAAQKKVIVHRLAAMQQQHHQQY